MLQNTINVAAQWARENELRYNPLKIYVLHYSSNKRESENEKQDYYLDNIKIQEATEVKDLGLWVDVGMNFKKHHRVTAGKALHVALEAKRTLGRCSFPARKRAWDTFILPLQTNAMLD